MSAVSFLSSLMMMLPGAADKAPKNHEENEPVAPQKEVIEEGSSTQSILPNMNFDSKSFVNCYMLERHAGRASSATHSEAPEQVTAGKPQRILAFSFTVEDIKRTMELGDTYVANSKAVKVEPIVIHGQYSVIFHTDGNAFEMPIPNHPARGSVRIGGIFNPYLQLSCRYENASPAVM